MKLAQIVHGVPAERGGAASRAAKHEATWRDHLLGPKLAPYLFIAPFFFLFAVFMVYPIVWSFVLSFQKWKATETTWVGLENYRYVLGSATIRKAFSNAVWYVVVNNLIQLTVPLLFAALLDFHFMRRISGVLRLAFFMPNLVSGVVAGLLFGIILGTGGMLTRLLAEFGVDILFLQSTEWSKPAVLLAGSWRWIGYWVVIYGAALQSIPDEYYEAAEIDGASNWQRFIDITLPMLRPILLFMFVINTIGTLQIFEEPFVLFGKTGGPLNSATTPVLELYRLGFIRVNLGAAAALGWLLAIGIAVISILQFRLAQRRGWTE